MTSESNMGSVQAEAIASGELLAAKRYALAAFEIAQEKGGTAAWQDGLTQIAEFMTDPEVRRVLESTRVRQEPKQHLVEAALADLPELQLNLARLLVRKNRTGLANEIAFAFTQMAEDQRGVSRVRARTAVPLSDAEREALNRRLQEQTGNEVILEVEVDPSLLGGLVVQIGDRLVDASTRNRLRGLREELVR